MTYEIVGIKKVHRSVNVPLLVFIVATMMIAAFFVWYLPTASHGQRWEFARLETETGNLGQCYMAESRWIVCENAILAPVMGGDE